MAAAAALEVTRGPRPPDRAAADRPRQTPRFTRARGLLPVWRLAADAPKASIPTFERAVNICTAEVQKTFPYGKFDTYLSGTNEVRWIGTQQEQFRFEKCMSQKGRPMEVGK